MPITRRQFDLGIDEKLEDWMRRIHSFLSARRAEAFSESELIAALGAQEKGLLFGDAVAKLAEIGAVETRKVGDAYYFVFKRDLPELR